MSNRSRKPPLNKEEIDKIVKPAWHSADDPDSYQRRVRSGFYPNEWFPISHSQIAVYDTCPKRYYFENVVRLEKESGEAAELGNDLHGIQLEIAELGIEGARNFVSAMVSLSKTREWKKLKEALDQIAIKREYLLSAEQRHHWTWPVRREYDDRELKVQFEAKIDLVFLNPFENWIEIIDGKSSDDVAANVDHDQQGLTYASILSTNLELAPFFESAQIIFTQAQWAKGRLVSTTFSLDELREWLRFLKEKVKRIVNDIDYEPRTGVHCQWCPFIFKCEAAQKKLPPVVRIAERDLPVNIASLDEAQQAAEGVAYLRAIVRRLESGLAGYLRFLEQTGAAGGPAKLEIPGGTWRFESFDNRKPEGGIEGLLARHPEERAGLTGKFYSRLVLKKKEGKSGDSSNG